MSETFLAGVKIVLACHGTIFKTWCAKSVVPCRGGSGSTVAFLEVFLFAKAIRIRFDCQRRERSCREGLVWDFADL